MSEQQARAGAYATTASSVEVGALHTNQVVQQHARDSVYAIRVSPATESMTSDPLSTQLSNWFDSTKSFAASMRDKTTSLLTDESAVSQNEPQRYGRAGGYVGVERLS
jgi:hypothetical protein